MKHFTKTLLVSLAVFGGVSSASADVNVTVNELEGSSLLRSSEISVADDATKVPYHKYNLSGGVLYTKGVTSKEFNFPTTIKEGASIDVTGYSDSKKTNVIFYLKVRKLRVLHPQAMQIS